MTKVSTQIEEAQRNKRLATSVAVDDPASILVNRGKGGRKPPYDSDKGSSSSYPHNSLPVNLRTATEGKTFPHAKADIRRKITLRTAITRTTTKDLSPGR